MNAKFEQMIKKMFIPIIFSSQVGIYITCTEHSENTHYNPNHICHPTNDK